MKFRSIFVSFAVYNKKAKLKLLKFNYINQYTIY